MSTAPQKITYTFQADTIPAAIVVAGCEAYPEANGVYVWSGTNSRFIPASAAALSPVPDTYAVKKVGLAWQLTRPATAEELAEDSETEEYAIAYTTEGPASPVAADWESIAVLEAVPFTVPASTKAILLSAIYTGGADGGFAGIAEGAALQLFTLGPWVTVVLDSRQVFLPGTVYISGQRGLSVQFSYMMLS